MDGKAKKIILKERNKITKKNKSLLDFISKSTVTKFECKLKDKCIEHCPGNIGVEVHGDINNIDYMFILPNAYESDLYCKLPATNTAGMTLRNILYKLLTLNKMDVNYVIACLSKFPYKDQNPYPVCIKNVFNEIEELKPKYLVLFGKVVVDNILPEKYHNRIDYLIGKYFDIDIYNRQYKTLICNIPSEGFINTDVLGDIYNILFNLIVKSKPKFKINYGDKNGINYKLLKNVKEIKEVLHKLSISYNPLVYDIETDGLSRLHCKVLLLQFYNGGKTGYAIPWDHKDFTWSNNDKESITKYLTQLFSNKSKYPFVSGHNLKFDYTRTLTILKVKIDKPLIDTMSGAYLLNETKTRDKESSDISEKVSMGGYSLAQQISYYGVLDEWYKDAKLSRSTLAYEDLEYVAKYGVGDVVNNFHVLKCQFQDAANHNYKNQYWNMQRYFYSEQIKLFATMELNGVLIDVDYLSKLTDKDNSPLLKYKQTLLEELKKLEKVKEANSLLLKNSSSVFGEEWVFDISKVDHKILLFIKVMNLEPTKMGKATKKYPKGQPSLDVAFKDRYKDEYKEVQIYNLIGRVDQLYGLYVKSFYNILNSNIDCKDGRIRPNFWGTTTRTGRISVSDPNSQQTIREDGTELVNIIRGLFTSSIGHVIIKLDIKANEVRCWGSVAKDENLKKIVLHGKKLMEEYFNIGPDDELKEKLKIEADLHYNSASLFYDLNIKEVTKAMRQDSKILTFGTIYGLTNKSLSKKLDKEIEEVKKLKKKFFGLYKNGKKWLNKIRKFAKINLYAENPMGRRRRLYQYLLMYPMSKYSSKNKLLLEPFYNNYGKIDGRIESIYAMGDRRAMNIPIQAIGSDIAIIASFLLQKYIELKNKPWKIFNVVHDSTEAEVPITDIEEYILIAKVIYEYLTERYIFNNFNYRLYCPTEVEFEVGFRMNEMVKWDGARKSLKDLQKKFVKDNANRERTLTLKDVTIKL